MVPTFCELLAVCASAAASRRHPELSGSASDGDLPLAGEGGGLPNRESLSLICGGCGVPKPDLVCGRWTAGCGRFFFVGDVEDGRKNLGRSEFVPDEPTAWRSP